MKVNQDPDGLSRRERQILEILYRRGQATAAEVQQDLPEAPSYSAVRALLRILEEKGHARHEEAGPRYLYLPAVPREQARRSALQNLVRTYFDDSASAVVAALLDGSSGELTTEEYDRLAELIAKAKRSGS